MPQNKIDTEHGLLTYYMIDLMVDEFMFMLNAPFAIHEISY